MSHHQQGVKIQTKHTLTRFDRIRSKRRKCNGNANGNANGRDHKSRKLGARGAAAP